LSFAGLIETIAPVFVVLACGFGLRRMGMLRAEADASLFRVAMHLLYPCLIADNVLGNPELRDFGKVIIPPLAGATFLCASFAITALVARILRLGRPQPAATFAFTAAIPNWGYLPIPIVLVLFPKSTTGVLFVFNIGLELVLWGVGIWVLSGHGSWRRALNIPFLAIIAALVLNLVHAHDWLPSFVLRSLRFMGEGALPLSLLLAGVSLADAVAAGGLTRDIRTTVAGCVVKLAIIPACALGAAAALPATAIELKRILVVQAAMPCAMIPVILARMYHADLGTAVRIVLATTVLGLITIPLWLHLGDRWVLSQPSPPGAQFSPGSFGRSK
jgi:malate permease and related proteins